MSRSGSSFYFRSRRYAQVLFLMVLGVLLLIAAYVLHPALPLGLFVFGLGLLIAAFIDPGRLVIAGLLLTLIGFAIFIAYKPLFRYDNALVVIAIGLALLGIALAARRGYVSASAFTPGILVILIGLLLYPPAGNQIDGRIAPFILSLSFPGAALILIGAIYLCIDVWKFRGK